MWYTNWQCFRELSKSSLCEVESGVNTMTRSTNAATRRHAHVNCENAGMNQSPWLTNTEDCSRSVLRSASKCWGLAGSTHFGICRSKMMDFARNVSPNLTHKGKMLTSQINNAHWVSFSSMQQAGWNEWSYFAPVAGSSPAPNTIHCVQNFSSLLFYAPSTFLCQLNLFLSIEAACK